MRGNFSFYEHFTKMPMYSFPFNLLSRDTSFCRMGLYPTDHGSKFTTFTSVISHTNRRTKRNATRAIQ